MAPRLLTCLLPFSLAAFSGCPAAPPGIAEGRSHWAFQPLKNEPPPSVRQSSWPRNDIDRFILAKIEAAGLQPSPEADPATLIRRITLNLIGLPPSPEEVERFVKETEDWKTADSRPERARTADSSSSLLSGSLPSAVSPYETLIDRLLASPRYGERWGRHWLDLARYADTSGFHNDLDRPFAWKYRDYVIDSFNADKPYGRFIAEQIAGDELNLESGIQNQESAAVIATGFCRNGPSNDDNMGKTPEAIAQYRADQMDDVISTTSSVFLGLTLGCARCHDHKTEPLTARDYYSLAAIFAGTERLGLPSGATDARDKKIKDTAQVMALIETKPQPPATHLLLRGLASSKGEETPPAVPAVLSQPPLAFPQPAGRTSLRRKTLADWIASPQNPLTWRVMANRVWQHHFGAGIVATPSNFGVSGARPSHPGLLDFLARQLIASGGKLKPLHKLILMSATYRQASGEPRAESGEGKTSDSLPFVLRSQLFGRMNLRRMEAEVIRDSILAASGRLNLQMGGPGIKPRIRSELLDASQRNKWPALKAESSEHWRRSIYIYVKRQLLMPGLELFDAPATTDSCAQRAQSTVPTQALVLMNDEFVEEQAGHLARRAAAAAGGDPARIVEQLFLITLSRKPAASRLQQSLDFLQSRQAAANHETALRDLAHVLLNSSEFISIE